MRTSNPASPPLINDLPELEKECNWKFIESLGQVTRAESSTSVLEDVVGRFGSADLLFWDACVLNDPITYLKTEAQGLFNPFLVDIVLSVLRTGESDFLYAVQEDWELLH